MLAKPAEGKQVDAFFITEFPEQTRETPPGGGVEIEPGVFGRFDNQASGSAVAGGSHPLPSCGQTIMGSDQLGNRLLSDDWCCRHRDGFVRKAIRADVPPLTESVAILLTLDDRHPEAALLPAKGTPTRAQALRWLLFTATEIYPIVEINDYPERFATDPDRIDAMRERAREIWRARWLVVEANVAGDPYLSSDGLSLTDIYLAVVSRWGQEEHWRPASLPKASVRRGRPPLAKPKVSTTIRLSQDVIDHFKAAGRGWQTRIDNALRDWIRTHDTA